MLFRSPVPDEPFVLPSVAFRPVRLAILSVCVGAAAIGLAAWAGPVMLGVFFSVGLALGLSNALLVKYSVTSITAHENPRKKKMALNSATRLLIITVIGLIIAYFFRPYGLGVLFGLAFFQVLLVLSTTLPVLRKLRSGEGDSQSAESNPTGAANPTGDPIKES